MKVLIAYYSHTGNTKWLSREIGNQLETVEYHQIQLENSNPAKGLWALIWYGFKSIFKLKMNILPDDLDLTIYDLVILGMPVWTDNVPPPMRQFIAKHINELSTVKVALFATFGGNCQHFFKKLARRLPDIEIAGTLAISTEKSDWKKHTVGKILDYLTKVLNKNIWISCN